MLNHLIIGASDAGISAAMRIKEIAPHDHVRIFLKDNFPNYSICGIPFYLSGEVTDRKTLAHRSTREIELLGIEIIPCQSVQHVNTNEKTINTVTGKFAYDKLLIATGANAVVPDIHGLELPGVFTLRWIDDMIAIDDYIIQNEVKDVIIVGGGYIGIEMADAFHRRGLAVTVVETSGAVLKTFDPEFGKKIEEELDRKNISVVHNIRITKIEGMDDRLTIAGTNNFYGDCDLIIVAAGARPNVQLEVDEDIAIGKSGAYRVNQCMETNITDVFAAGDCGETWHSLLHAYTYMPLGTTAHKQGRVAGANMAGHKTIFNGVVGTQVVKVFDLVAARTGLHDRDCEKHGIESCTVQSHHWDHKVYYPGAKEMHIRLTANPVTQKLLGMQIIGPATAEVAKRIDIAATAIQNNYSVDQLMDLDLSYTPPLSSPWDPVQMAAQAWLNKYNVFGNYRFSII